jgi:cytochrome c556
MKLKFFSIVAILASSLALPASAQFAKPEDAMKYRQSALFVMQQNFSRVAAMASGKAPFDAKLAAESAAVAAYMGKLPWAAFTPDSDLGNTKAKAEVWSKRAKFDDLSKQLQAELDKLAVAAKSGNMDAIKASVGASGKVCKACHDDYRAK